MYLAPINSATVLLPNFELYWAVTEPVCYHGNKYRQKHLYKRDFKHWWWWCQYENKLTAKLTAY